MQRILLNLTGPSCSGKTTLKNVLSEKFPGVYNVSFDKLKWLLSGYDRSKHAGMICSLTLGYLDLVLKQGLPIILEAPIIDQGQFQESVVNATNKYGYRLVTVKLTAPTELLLERFHARQEHANQTGNKISITNDEDFITSITRERFVPNDAIVYDSSVLSSEQIASSVVALL